MLLDEYGVHPWQMDRWTGQELTDLMEHHRQRLIAERDQRLAEEER